MSNNMKSIGQMVIPHEVFQVPADGNLGYLSKQ